MKYKYAYNKDEKNTARVVGRDITISRKQAIEICNYIRGRDVAAAKHILEGVLEKKTAIPFRRFCEGAGHKHGAGPGKFPVNAAVQFLKLLKLVEANAQNQGLGTNLKITHACAQMATEPYHYGRRRGLKTKRAHIEIVVVETEKKSKDRKAAASKKEASPEHHAKQEAHDKHPAHEKQ